MDAILGPTHESSLPIVVIQPEKKDCKKNVLCWSGMTETERYGPYKRCSNKLYLHAQTIAREQPHPSDHSDIFPSQSYTSGFPFDP